MNSQQLEMLAREYIRDNKQLTLGEELLLSHFVGHLRQHTPDAVRPNGAPVTDNKRSWSLLKGG